MNRRSFFTKLSSAVAGCYFALGASLPSSKLKEEVIDVVTKEYGPYPINTDYINADFEVHFWCSKETYEQLLKDPPINLKGEKIDISKWQGESILDKLKNA